jgi:hypothetical protein
MMNRPMTLNAAGNPIAVPTAVAASVVGIHQRRAGDRPGPISRICVHCQVSWLT